MSGAIVDDEHGVLSVEDLRIEAASQGSARVLVSRVALSAERGEAVGIVGESGSGKSLTARAMAGILPSGLTATGQVSVDGVDLLTANERTRRRVRGSGVSLVLQDPFTMLSPLRRCGTHIADGIRTHRSGTSKAEIAAEVERRLRR